MALACEHRHPRLLGRLLLLLCWLRSDSRRSQTLRYDGIAPVLRNDGQTPLSSQTLLLNGQDEATDLSLPPPSDS